MADRWVLERAGITNVYQYADETLHFGGGRLLLRGVNGSGKSTAMNMLLPFLLDADTRRIDAAGEQSRVLRSWMLAGRDEAAPVGYLWIELRRGDEHFVCGCGIRANRSTDRVTTWWFVTSRRPGIDLSLVEGRVPLSADALRQALGPHAVFSQEQRVGYRAAIRDALYGGADLDQHIRLLHVVRNPRVGDRIDVDLPTYLEDALPQLSEAALDDAAQPLEDLEEHRRNVEDLTRTAAALDGLNAIFRSYARGELRRRAEEALALVGSAAEHERALATAQRAHREALAAADTATDRVGDLDHTILRLGQEIAALERRDAYQEGRQLDDLRSHVSSLAGRIAVAASDRDLRSKRHDDAGGAVAWANHQVDDDLRALTTALSELAGLAVAGGLAERPPDVPALDLVDLQPPDLHAPAAAPDLGPARARLAGVRAAGQHRRGDVSEVASALDRAERAEADLREAEHRQAAAHQLAADDLVTFTAARDTLDEVAAAWRRSLLEWLGRVERFRLDHAMAPAGDLVPIELVGRRTEVVTALSATADAAIDHHRRDRATLLARRQMEQATVDEAQAAVAALAERILPDPPALPWQRDDRAVALAELIDFADDLDRPARAGLEAAMEACGLLGAELAGDDLRLRDGQLVARRSTPVHAPLARLLTVSMPDAIRDRVRPGAVRDLLESISISADDLDAPTATLTVVTIDGEFRLGALRGRHTKDAAEHIGVTARRAALERQRADAAATLLAAETDAARTDADIGWCEGFVAEAVAIRQALPSADDVTAASTRVELTEAALGQSRQRAYRADDDRDAAELAHAESVDAARRTAATLDLPDHRDGLRRVDELLGEVTATCDQVDGLYRALLRGVGQWRDRADDWGRARDDLAASEHTHRSLVAEHEPLAMRLATLEDSIGAEYAEIVAALDLSRGDLHTASSSLDAARDAQIDAAKTAAQTETHAAEADRRRRAADLECVAYLPSLHGALAVPGLVVTAMDRSDPPDADRSAGSVDESDRPSFPAVVESPAGLRQLADAVLGAVPAPERGGTTADGLRQSLRQRRDGLGAGWDAEDHQPDEVLPVTIEVVGPLGRMPLPDAAVQVHAQRRRLASLLTAKQDQALRNLLQGLIAREVAEKLHRAGDLVTLMNKRLDTVTTSHGIGVSLRWRRRDDLDGSLASTIELLAKPPDLRTSEQDQQLAAALSERIADARAADPEAPYRELVGQVLDYRTWHRMTLVLRRPGRPDETLTRRTALSEGEKKMVSYLPLFAAVAASCDALAAAAPTAPRFVLLDDAFAKVSEDNHAKLFGLLVELDLDFIATSERLWGTHDTVPELAITEVLRDAGLGVIVLEHSRWDGHRRTGPR